jgi:hypothetical protein
VHLQAARTRQSLKKIYQTNINNQTNIRPQRTENCPRTKALQLRNARANPSKKFINKHRQRLKQIAVAVARRRAKAMAQLRASWRSYFTECDGMTPTSAGPRLQGQITTKPLCCEQTGLRAPRKPLLVEREIACELRIILLQYIVRQAARNRQRAQFFDVRRALEIYLLTSLYVSDYAAAA